MTQGKIRWPRGQGDKVTSEGEKEEEQNKRKKHRLKDPLPSFTMLYDALRRPQSCDRLKNAGIPQWISKFMNMYSHIIIYTDCVDNQEEYEESLQK